MIYILLSLQMVNSIYGVYNQLSLQSLTVVHIPVKWEQNRRFNMGPLILEPENRTRVQYVIPTWIIMLFIRAGEPANFLVAPAPDIFFSSSSSWFFSQAALASAHGIFFPSGFFSGSKGPKKNGSCSWLLVKFGKIFFSPKTSKVKLQKI